MKIALDAVGGDHGLAPNIDGAVQAANAFGVELVLVGPEEPIRAELSSRGIGPGDSRFEIADAPDLVGMNEEPVAACRAKPRSSIMVCAELVAAGRAAGMVSAGNSGATMAAVTLWHLKRIPGILRPAIAVPIPTSKGVTVLLDAGANVDCKPDCKGLCLVCRKNRNLGDCGHASGGAESSTRPRLTPRPDKG